MKQFNFLSRNNIILLRNNLIFFCPETILSRNNLNFLLWT